MPGARALLPSWRGLLAAALLLIGCGQAFAAGEIEIRAAVTRPGFSGYTSQEMRDAKPYPLPEVPGEAASGPLPIGLSDFGAGFAPGSPPEGWDALEPGEPPAEYAPQGYAYPPPFARWTNFDLYERYPYSAVGRLFFQQQGEVYVCSAASVGNYAIWTAGHCIHVGDGSREEGWSSNMVFVPAYQDGRAPFGQWKAVRVAAPRAWRESGDYRFDFGAAVLARLDGRKISQAVGSLGFAWNQRAQQHWFDFGYPVLFPFGGEDQVICASSFAYRDPSFGQPAPVGIGCDQTAGCSGGPWILGFGGGNYLNGVNSYRYNSRPADLYSPYFSEDAHALWLKITSLRP